MDGPLSPLSASSRRQKSPLSSSSLVELDYVILSLLIQELSVLLFPGQINHPLFLLDDQGPGLFSFFHSR